MNNNLPMKAETGFINKIKNFFKKLLYKNNTDKVEVQENVTIEKNIEDGKVEFRKSIKIDVDNSNLQQEFAREELYKNTRNNPELLQDLSIEQLEELNNYYDKKIEKNSKIIEEKEEIIRKLKKVS